MKGTSIPIGFLVKLIGTVIMIGIITILFSGFAAPFLEVIADSTNIKAFNKFTNLMTETCKEGVYTVPYIHFYAQSPVKIYAIGLINQITARTIKNMPTCDEFTKTHCVSSLSKSRITKCMSSETTCWCLFKIEFESGLGRTYNYCGNYEQNILTVERLNPYDADGNLIHVAYANHLDKFNEWNNKLSADIQSGAVKKLSVLECKTLHDIGCVDSRTGVLIYPSYDDKNEYVVWISPLSREDTLLGQRWKHSIWLDSMSMQRAVADYGFDYYMKFYSNPDLSWKRVDSSTHIYKENCPS